MQFVLFKCDWIDDIKGKKIDEFKMTLVNFSHLLYNDSDVSNEPFILASQAEQVCYIPDPVKSEWTVLLKMTARDLFDIYSKNDSNNVKSVSQVEPFNEQHLDETIYTRDDDVHWVREGVDRTIVDDMRSIDDDVEMDEDE